MTMTGTSSALPDMGSLRFEPGLYAMARRLSCTDRKSSARPWHGPISTRLVGLSRRSSRSKFYARFEKLTLAWGLRMISYAASSPGYQRNFSMSVEIKPFRIAVGDDVLDDLKSRLRRTRWPEAELVDDWSQGAPLQWIQEVCGYWAETYDWRRR